LAFFCFLSGEGYDYQNEGGHVGKEEYDAASHPASQLTLDDRIEYLYHKIELLKIIKPGKNENIIEMGCGYGLLGSFMEECGCNYFGIDASDYFVWNARKLMFSGKIKEQIQTGSFFDIDKFNVLFDKVLFEASFHHCDDPVRLLKMLYERTTNDAQIFFIHELINNSYSRRPWGIIRGEGDAILEIVLRKWLELGFRFDFFKELLARTGWRLKSTKILRDSSKLFVATKR